MDPSNSRFLVVVNFLDPLFGGDGFLCRSLTLNFLFNCFTVDTSGLLNESRASDTSVLKVGKKRSNCGLGRDVVTFESCFTSHY